MNILLFRRSEINDATLGTLMVVHNSNILFQCATLEPKVREKKIMGCTAIPSGTYEVKYQYSSKFAAQMPFLQNVPNFSGVMIHVGNEVKNTQGCILVGTHNDSEKAYIYNSRLTFNLLDKLIKDFGSKTVRISIYDMYNVNQD